MLSNPSKSLWLNHDQKDFSLKFFIFSPNNSTYYKVQSVVIENVDDVSI